MDFGLGSAKIKYYSEDRGHNQSKGVKLEECEQECDLEQNFTIGDDTIRADADGSGPFDIFKELLFDE